MSGQVQAPPLAGAAAVVGAQAALEQRQDGWADRIVCSEEARVHLQRRGAQGVGGCWKQRGRRPTWHPTSSPTHKSSHPGVAGIVCAARLDLRPHAVQHRAQLLGGLAHSGHSSGQDVLVGLQ